MNKNILLLGGHVSISGSMDKAFERGESIHCNAIQIFTKSNRQWHAEKITNMQAEQFISTFKKSSINSVVAHASYLINIASADKLVAKKSFSALKDELERCDKLEIPYLVLHPGTRGDGNQEECLKNIATCINEIYSSNEIKATLLLENMAGQGTSVASKFEQLAAIFNQIEHKHKIGICFDTCHAFAAGYDFRTEESYEKMWQEFNAILGFNYLKVIHLNDSKKDLGCKVDRHEFLAKGKIGKEAISLLVNDPRFFNVIKILEVPVESVNDYIPDIQLILNLLSEKNINLIRDTPFEFFE